MKQRIQSRIVATSQHTGANNTLPSGIRDKVARFPGAITAKQLAEILGVGEELIYKQARAGLIPNFRIGTAVRFDPSAICKWLDTRVL
jgi:excisionase family DNA binding protein